ncbi:MAG: hypothetical protein HDR15_10715 [Lachnospiraceae bacterium]|nr:hypothetical protein [Lachnospiraceae bacterium]
MGVMPAITVVRILIVMLVLPLMCGSFFAACLRRHEGRGFLLNAYLFGWIVVFCLFELVCTPYVVTLGKFSSFCKVYNPFLLFAAFASIAAAAVVLCRRRKPAEDTGTWTSEDETDAEEYAAETGEDEAGEEERAAGISGDETDEEERAAGTSVRETDGKAARDKTAWWAWILWAIVIASVLVQMAFFYFYNHMNGDDSYYIAQSVITDFVDTMYQRDAYTGTPMGLDVRHALSVLPVFVTWLGRVCGLHAATAAHAVLGPVLLAICYGAYALVGRALFSKNRSVVPLFVLLVQVWYVWSNVSIFTPETFLYTRTWQGKAVFANIILPLAFYLLYRLLTEWKAVYMALLMILSVAGIFTTTASVYLLSALYGITALYCLITQRRWKKCFRIAVCVIPAFLYGLVYLWLLRTW